LQFSLKGGVGSDVAMDCGCSDTLGYWGCYFTLGVCVLEKVTIVVKVVTSINTGEVKVKESGWVVWGGCAQFTFEIIDGIVVGGEEEELGTFLIEVNGSCGEVGNDGGYADESVE